MRLLKGKEAKARSTQGGVWAPAWRPLRKWEGSGGSRRAAAPGLVFANPEFEMPVEQPGSGVETTGAEWAWVRGDRARAPSPSVPALQRGADGRLSARPPPPAPQHCRLRDAPRGSAPSGSAGAVSGRGRDSTRSAARSAWVLGTEGRPGRSDRSRVGTSQGLTLPSATGSDSRCRFWGNFAQPRRSKEGHSQAGPVPHGGGEAWERGSGGMRPPPRPVVGFRPSAYPPPARAAC